MEGFGLLRRFFCALLALTLCILFAAPARGEGVYDLIRLHVVASGDTDWEQAVKLAVRDACLEKAREVTVGCADADEAYAAKVDHCAKIVKNCLITASIFEGINVSHSVRRGGSAS